MKKFLLAVSLFFAVGSQAQNINLIDLEGNDVTNGTVYIFIDTASIDPYEHDLHVANATSVSASMKCARTLNNLIPIAESYFQLSEGSAINETINTEELEGFPTCPCCANPYSFAMCGMCHKIHCIAGEGACTCPWCGSQGRYGAGEGGMDVGRAQG